MSLCHLPNFLQLTVKTKVIKMFRLIYFGLKENIDSTIHNKTKTFRDQKV